MIIPLGGGGSKVVASIAVTYPAGSTLTCTLGSKVLTAQDTSGKWVFGLPSIGDWVVKAVKGSQSASKAVSITTEGQVETVTLMFELLLFNNGLVDGIAWDYVYNQDTDASSSISDVIKLSSRSWDNNISLQRPVARRGISSAIDLSKYSMLKIRTKVCAQSNGDAELWIGSSLAGHDLGEASITKTAGQTTSIDVSAIAKSSFITIWARSGNEYGDTIDISFNKVWLE